MIAASVPMPIVEFPVSDAFYKTQKDRSLFDILMEKIKRNAEYTMLGRDSRFRLINQR